MRTNKTETGSILEWSQMWVWSYRRFSGCRVHDRNRNSSMWVWFHNKVENSVLLEFVNKCLRAVALIWMSVLSLLSLSWYKCADGRAFLRQTLHWKPTSLIKSNSRQLECAESRNQQFIRKQFGHSLELWPTDLTWISNVKITPIILKDFIWWITKDQIGVWDLSSRNFCTIQMFAL